VSAETQADASTSVRTLLAAAREALRAQQPAGALEAEVLLGHVMGVDRAWLFANSERLVGPAEKKSYSELIARRLRGEPLAYLTGVREFWSLPLRVTPDVLIPRPETELLVQAVLDFVPPDAAWRIADLGTGSGAIAIAIARERPACEVHATDSSPAALAVAEENAARLLPASATGGIRFHLGDWLLPLEGRFRVIAANPPYVAANDPHLHQGDCRFEPRAALTPGPDGLAAIRHIAAAARDRLEAGGLLAFEHGFDQGTACRELLRSLGYRAVRTQCDLQGLERVSAGQRS
jgi:release factor glutamine methyltransferase